MVRKCGAGASLALVILIGMAGAAQAAGDKGSNDRASTQIVQTAFAAVGQETRAPIGWVDFCNERENAGDCHAATNAPRDIVMTQTAWRDLQRVNQWVNENVRPMTDLDHYGVVEKWAYPTDGYGDCEDYVLQKRKMLIDAGWPREALLITVVRDKRGDGHAVLTVKSDKGEFILDNQNEEIVLWTETGYRFVKRQSQYDVNVWVSLGDQHPAIPVVSAR